MIKAADIVAHFGMQDRKLLPGRFFMALSGAVLTRLS